MKNDNLGDRIKEQYENRTKYFLPRRSYSIIRIDGKAFHSLTRNMHRPFDYNFIGCMDKTAIALCEEIQGAKFAYVQSDEISVLLTDFDDIKTEAWFNGNIQKIVSVSASIATEAFNKWIRRGDSLPSNSLALFDSRVFTIPDPIEVENYFIWRQQDCSRNSINSAGQSVYSHKELHEKNTSEVQEMLFQKGINWNDYPPRCKRGGFIQKYEKINAEGIVEVRDWLLDADCPIFTQDREYLRSRIPVITR